jgi:hypothetical protein
MLLPPDLREWVPANHLVHFVINAIGELDVRMATRQRAGQRERAAGKRMESAMAGMAT